MFHSTRLKLTAWYLLLIMLISFIFSVVIFVDVNRELVRFEHYQELRQERIREQLGEAQIPYETNPFDEQLVYEARSRLIASLVVLNICILAGAGIAGYFLAGRTLDPIKKAVEDQARFIGDASHELKTPLTTLRSEIEVYLMGRKRTLAESDAILRSNLEEVIRLQGLTEHLMSLTSLERTVVSFEKVELLPVIEGAIRSVSSVAREKKISIINKSTKITVVGNVKSLTQLFTILLDNAIKYSNPSTKITIRSHVLGGVATIDVSDQGIGIPEDEQEKIFDRFYRVDKSRNSTEVPGYGLGLSIAKEIVTMHKGALSCTSSKKGSTFSVELPV